MTGRGGAPPRPCYVPAVRALARVLSIALTVIAAACAALIVVPAPVKALAFFAIVVDEKAFLLVLAALVGAGLARVAGSPRWTILQGLLALATIVVAALPPTQAIRLAVQRHVALDLPRYLSASIDTGAPHPSQTVVYATVEGRPLSLDVYKPAAASGRVPAVIILHGGGWSGGDKGEAPLASAWLAAHGHAVFDVEYRTTPQPNWKTAIGDVKCAIGWVKRDAAKAGVDVDPARVALLGRSAGGHLALLAAYAPADPALPPSCEAGDTSVAAVISFYGPTDLAWGYAHPANPRVFDTPSRLTSYIGGTPASEPERYRLMSPVTRVAAGAPRTLLIHGDRDQFIAASHPGLLTARLSALGVPHEALVIPYAQHAFDFVSGGLSGQLAEHAVLATLTALGSRR
jgi:acetyl esterase/lipase